VHLLVASAVIVCLASITGHAEAASAAIGDRLAASPAHARLQGLRAQAARREEASRAGSISSSTRDLGDARALPARTMRSFLTRTVVSCSTGIAGMRRGSRAPAVEEREEKPRRRVSRLRSRAERLRSVGRAVSSSQLQANRSGESNIPGASAREELASPPPLRAPPRLA